MPEFNRAVKPLAPDLDLEGADAPEGGGFHAGLSVRAGPAMPLLPGFGDLACTPRRGQARGAPQCWPEWHDLEAWRLRLRELLDAFAPPKKRQELVRAWARLVPGVQIDAAGMIHLPDGAAMTDDAQRRAFAALRSAMGRYGLAPAEE